MVTLHRRAIAAQDHGLGVFFPDTTKFVAAETYSNGGRFSRAPPKMAAQLTRRKNDVQESRALQIIEFLCRLFNVIRLTRTLIDESPQRFRGRCAHPSAIAHSVVPLKLRVA